MISNIYFIPKNFKITLIRKKINFLILNDFFIKLILPVTGFIKINKYSNTILNKNKFSLNLFLFFKSYSLINIETLKFKGKGYKLTKKNNVLNFLFNFSHISYFIGEKTLIKKTNKNRFLLMNWDYKKLINMSNNIRNKRFINIYNYNGLRFKRQIVYKRKGKTITS